SMHPMLDFEIIIIGPDLSDTFGLKRSANPIFYDVISGEPCGMSYPRTGDESPGRVVFLSFPFDAIPETGPAPNTRATIMRRIIQFLVPGLDGAGTIALDREGYTIPDTVTIEVGDTDLAGAGTITIECYTSVVTNRVPVTLTETARRGLFRGTATLANMAASPGLGILRANNGATIYATYLDQSGGVVLQATAVVDLDVPELFALTVEPDYQEAMVSWETTEFTDALVEYGESPFLGRTFYAEDLDTEHMLTLPNLKPDSLYYFRITSRDAAGNTVGDDNNEQLYTFHTLAPLLPPVSEHFDSGTEEWSEFSGEDSQTHWTLGVPDNGVETSAVSPPNAWGSSLKGDVADTIDAFLISPAIHLTGGNAATLRFNTSYDFSERSSFDLLEFGELLVFTNNVGYVTAATFEDISGGWYEEEIDLSPFAGQVIYLVWHHQLLAFDSASRPGWLIDDVSVTMSSTPHGTLRVTNNLSQATFTINGPFSTTAQGASYLNTNAPPGDYVVSFGNVPFYSTPAAQSKTLAANSTEVFTGTYTFTDANTNGMSDAWETNYFGGAAPGRTQFTDSDADGMTDYAEFLAGTSPTNQSSLLRFLAPAPQNTGVTRLDWPTVPGRSYRIHGSADLTAWSVLQDWTRANGNILSYTTTSTNGWTFFRLEVKP
ncbi:MAG TPA: choice-of-anchor J domain-containing protein, partial [Candidatus Acidoferrum sp.]|nr:choice-of-anchor J domain-containing protein [Candidatus Acidoferrum sp.]